MTKQSNSAANFTLYIPLTEDLEAIRRARKLLAFHEDKTISAFLVEKAKEIVKKYDKPTRQRKEVL